VEAFLKQQLNNRIPMKSRFLYVLIFASIISCAQKSNRDEAIKYYNSFSEIFEPFKMGTERFMRDSKRIVESRIKGPPGVLTRTDSIEAIRLIKDFESLSITTATNLQSLKNFDGNNLNVDALNFVNSSTKLIKDAFGKVLFKDRDSLAKDKAKTTEELSLGVENLINLNSEIRKSQTDFLKKYDIPIAD
jgi:hypothetical protein